MPISNEDEADQCLKLDKASICADFSINQQPLG